MPSQKHCPCCCSANLWADQYQELTYKHCYDCTYCWDVWMEAKLELLAIDAKEHKAFLDAPKDPEE